MRSVLLILAFLFAASPAMACAAPDNSIRATFMALDTNQDEKLEEDEYFKPFMTKNKELNEGDHAHFMTIDRDASGDVTLAEFMLFKKNENTPGC